MSSPLLVVSTDLELWANRRDAQARLPQMLRRLILATVDDVEHIAFRSDEGVQLGGWDGTLQTRTGGTFVPAGYSAWEAGAGKDPAAKANDDYTKRTAAPLGLVLAETTFVFVTLRRWHGKEAWADARRKEGLWKDVRVLDADDLATWLEEAPAVHLWLSILLGKKPAGVEDLASFWSNWSGVTQPPMAPQLLLAGRQSISAELTSALSGAATALGLKAETREEAVAFIAATIENLPAAERDRYLARTAIVSEPAAWSAVVATERPLILVPTFADRSIVAAATNAGHHVLLPCARSEPKLRGTLELPRLDRDEAGAELKKMGLSEERSRELAAVGRSSLGALRRTLALHAAGLVPTWAQADDGRELLPALLAGSWDDSVDADRSIIARLADRPYTEYREELLRWANEADAPIRLIGTIWTITAKEDAWTLIAGQLATVDLERFAAAALDVLGEVHPKYDLAAEEQWLAAVHRKVLKHSEQLRQGIADSLALMASVREPLPNIAPLTTEQLGDRIVRRLFADASSWRSWASLTDELPLLAEAAPDAFLDAVERAAAGAEPVLKATFVDANPMMVKSPHVGVLWALEVLAWSPRYLGRAAILLARLAQIDPGGKVANRPANSLREIFLPWHPGTSANVEQRLRVLDTLRKKEPSAAWNLLAALVPEQMAMSSLTMKPRYSDWAPGERREVDTAEFFKISAEVIKYLREDVGSGGARWKTLIDALGNVPEGEFDAIAEKLTSTEPLITEPEDRAMIRNSLRTFVAHHRSFPGTNWALPEDDLRRLDEVLARFQPVDPLERNVHLFGQHHGVVGEDASDWEGRDGRLEEMQVRAVGEIFAAGGLTGVLSLVKKAEEPFAAGAALGRIALSDADESDTIEQLLGAADASLRNAGRGFLRGRAVLRGSEWLRALYGGARWQAWEPAQKLDYLLVLPFNSASWDQVDAESGEVQELYWKSVNPLGRGGVTPTDRARATRSFMRFGQAATALHFLSVYSRPNGDPVEPDLAAAVLEGIANSESRQLDVPWANLGYDVAKLLGVASADGSVDKSRIAKLEWFFLPLLKRFREPEVLEEMLAADPALFVSILKIVYPSKDEKIEEIPEDVRLRAMQGADLLEGWHRAPGLGKDGRVDEEHLRAWISKVRELAATAGREEVAERHIARLLARLPKGQDGAWPHEVAREIIEETANDIFDAAIRSAIYNSRGLVRRPIGEGGKQERVIAARYTSYAEALADQWPRTARLARSIAATYEGEAREQDTRAELDKQRWR